MPRRLTLHATQDGEWRPSVARRDVIEVHNDYEYHELSSEMDNMSVASGSNIIVAAQRPKIMIPAHHGLPSFLDESSFNTSMIQAFRVYRSLAEERDSCLQALQSGPLAIIEKVLDFERSHRSLDVDYIDETAAYMVEIILATDPQVLYHHARGDFVRRYLEDPAFKTIVMKLESQPYADERPSIYRITIADNSGNGHNADQLQRCLYLFERYCCGSLSSETMRAIDGSDDLDESQTIRELPSTQSIQAFISNTSRRHNAFQEPLSYVGVTTEPARRRAAHERGSQRLMSLFLAVSKHVCPEKNFKAHWHPLFLCFEPAHGIAGELLFERTGCGLIATGGGFAGYPAGTRVRAMNRYSALAWADWTSRAMANTDYHARADAFQSSCEVWKVVKRCCKSSWRITQHRDELNERFPSELY